MHNTHKISVATLMSALLCSSATAGVIINSVDGDPTGTGLGGFARGLDYVSSTTFGTVTNNTDGNNDLLYGAPIGALAASDLGQAFTFSFEVNIAAQASATDERFTNVGYLVRFFSDIDGSGNLNFGADSEFANRISFENPFDTVIDPAGTGGFVTVSVNGTVPLVDVAGNAIDSFQVNAAFPPSGEAGGAEAQIRNVRFETVPEPSTSLLAGLAGLAALGFRRRK